MHTKPSPAAAAWSAVRAIHWSNLVVVVAAVAGGALVAGWTGAAVGGAVVITVAVVVVNRDHILALLARLPGRAGALFRDPGGPVAVDRFRDTVDALDLHMTDEPEAGDWDAWDIGLQRLTDARAAAAQHVSPARRLMGW